jgi:predicted transcriptional regulator
LISIYPYIGCDNILTEKVSDELEMLRRHLIILKHVVENEPIGILKLAEETKIPSHKVRYSLRVLEQERLIAASAPGAITTESTKPFLEQLDKLIDKLALDAKALKRINIEH